MRGVGCSGGGGEEEWHSKGEHGVAGSGCSGQHPVAARLTGRWCGQAVMTWWRSFIYFRLVLIFFSLCHRFLILPFRTRELVGGIISVTTCIILVWCCEILKYFLIKFYL
jgi:hypothetical protein